MSETEQSVAAGGDDLRVLLRPLWRYRWLIVAIVVFSTVATYVASDRQDPRYRATTEVFIGDTQTQYIVEGRVLPPTDRDTIDQARLMVSRPVLRAVIEALGLRESSSDLAETVTATPVLGSNFVTATAERDDAGEAAAVANELAEQYIATRVREINDGFDVALERVRRQLRDVASGSATREVRANLRDTIRRLQSARATAPTQLRHTERAVIPTEPFSPTPARDAVFAFVVALALAIALAFALHRFDRRIRRVDEVPEVYGIPLLAAVPHTSKPARIVDGVAQIPDGLREPFQRLRTNVQLALIEGQVKALTITSALPGEGKSTIVRNLALTYREWGLNVVVVDADLRRPVQVGLFGLPPTDRGLVSILTGDVELDDALLDVAVDLEGLEYLDRVRGSSTEQSGQAEAASATAARLAVLPSGTLPPNPQAVLAAERTRQVLRALAERFDVVLIDTAPLLAVGDTVPLLDQSDGVVLVGRVGRTDRGAATRGVAAVRQVPGATLLGVVANDLPGTLGDDYGGLGYDYVYGHAYRTTGNGRR